MIIFGNKKGDGGVARIDTEIIAFNIEPEDVEQVAQFLAVTIGTKCMMEYGIPPEELQ